MADSRQARSPSNRVVRLRGDLTATSGEALLDVLRRTARPAGTVVAIDLSQVTNVDPGGVAALLDACVATTLRRGTLRLAGVTTACRSMLARAGVLDVIDVMDDEAAGIRT